MWMASSNTPPMGPESLPSELGQLEALRSRVARLETALVARIAIEQAAGILAERHDLGGAEARELIRYAARRSGVTLRRLCSQIAPGEPSPSAILVALERDRASPRRPRA